MSEKKVFADHPYFTAIIMLTEAREALDRAIEGLREKQKFGVACNLRAVFKHLGDALPELARH